jgi:hypothetical protein
MEHRGSTDPRPARFDATLAPGLRTNHSEAGSAWVECGSADDQDGSDDEGTIEG